MRTTTIFLVRYSIRLKTDIVLFINTNTIFVKTIIESPSIHIIPNVNLLQSSLQKIQPTTQSKPNEVGKYLITF